MEATLALTPAVQNNEAVKLHVLRDALIITYDPTRDELSIDPLGSREFDVFVRNFGRVVDQSTGGVLYVLDRTNYTWESVATIGKFSISATSYKKEGVATKIDGPTNIMSFEMWLVDRGDVASAEKIRKFFPVVFAPPTTQEPQPQPAKKRSWFRR